MALTYSWNTINASQCDADSPLDEVLMEAIRQNQIHLEEWLGQNYTAASDHDHSGVNSALVANLSIAEGKLATSAVAQAKIKTTTGEVSGIGNKVLPGGQYGFYPQVKYGGTVYVVNATIVSGYLGQTYITYINLSSDYGLYPYALQRYIQASPPYNLGNGDIPLFVFAVIDSLGKIESVYCAEDPPWANNGQTDIRPDFHRDGKAYQLKKQIPKLETVIDNPAALTGYLASLDKMPLIETEITHDIKNADMPLIPHPFTGNDLAGKTVVMLDPVGSFCEKLHQMALAGESINEILHKGYLKLDNIPLAVNAPLGVMAVKANWK